MEHRKNLQAPLLLIGAGRSGSTLLARMLDAHPAVSIRGETGFLAPRIWQQVWDNRFWFDWREFVAEEPASSLAPAPTPSPQRLAEESQRVGAILATTLCDLLRPDPQKSHWGFKEVWNGSAAHRHSWTAYDALFPNALWIHLIREPLAFVRSCVAWTNADPNVDYLEQRLADWSAMVDCSRLRRQTDRFVEIRYEDLVAEPKRTLSLALNRVGVSWSDHCLGPLSHRQLASPPFDDSPILDRLQSVMPSDRFIALVDELGYTDTLAFFGRSNTARA